MVTCPSHSPEHNYPPTGQFPAPGPTVDNALIRDLFNHVIQASEILGVYASFRTNVLLMRDKLPPSTIGANGNLQEWLEDVGGGYDTHRHMSTGLLPGDEISDFMRLRQSRDVSMICGGLRLTLRGAGRGE
jgi:alpha-L-fucosidase 2